MDFVMLALLEEEERRLRPRAIVSISPLRAKAFDLDEKDFIENFRLSKDLACRLVEMLRPKLAPVCERKNVFAVEDKVLCALLFFGDGSPQRCVTRDYLVPMSQQSVSNCVIQVSGAIEELLLKQYIKFPTDERQLEMLRNEFLRKCGIPGVIGAIDCTHVALSRPPGDPIYTKSFMNRKHFYSINVQLVCDHQMNILNILARFPGSSHDSYIYRSSALHRYLSTRQPANTCLLGDAAYPQQSWLLTPQKSTDPSAVEFNAQHTKGREVIEQVNDDLKSRFRCLLRDRTLNYSPRRACAIINSCAVLHNMCNQANLLYEGETVLGPDDLPFNTAHEY